MDTLTSPPDSSLYRARWPGYKTTRDHSLRLNVWNEATGVTVLVSGVVGAEDGHVAPFAYTLIPTTDGLLTQKTLIVEDGILLSCQVVASAGAPLGAQTYARLELVQGSTGNLQTLATIAKGYLSATVPIFYPGDGNARAVDGRGTWRSVVGAAPAAGADFTVTVPANRRWMLTSIAYTLTAGAAVANRLPVLTIDDGTNTLWEAFNNTAVTANQAVSYRAGAGVPISTIQALDFQLSLPTTLLLGAGFRIRSVTAALAAADQYSAQILNVEEWFDV